MPPEPEIKQVDAASPCVCSSGKAWGKCCGALLEKKSTFAVSLKVTDDVTTHFFITDILGTELYSVEGRPAVFTSRAQAVRLAETLLPKALVVWGMGSEKWALFQRDMPNFMLIPEGNA